MQATSIPTYLGTAADALINLFKAQTVAIDAEDSKYHVDLSKGHVVKISSNADFEIKEVLHLDEGTLVVLAVTNSHAANPVAVTYPATVVGGDASVVAQKTSVTLFLCVGTGENAKLVKIANNEY